MNNAGILNFYFFGKRKKKILQNTLNFQFENLWYILNHPISSCPGLGHNSIRIFVENKYLAIIVKFVIFQSPFLLASSWPTSSKTCKRLPMVQYLKLYPFILIMLSFQPNQPPPIIQNSRDAALQQNFLWGLSKN